MNFSHDCFAVSGKGACMNFSCGCVTVSGKGAIACMNFSPGYLYRCFSIGGMYEF